MASDNPLKRGIEDERDFASEYYAPPPHGSTSIESKAQEMPSAVKREPSPALSISTTLSSVPPSIAGSSTGLQTTPGGSSGPPSKKRKLTPEEKEQLRLEKEARARQREEKRVQKEAENAVKEEERRVKAEKRRQEAEVKEEKQRAKDLAKKQKDEEDAKKQRAQLRLGSFFIKATPTKPTPSSPKHQQDDFGSPSTELPATAFQDSPTGTPTRLPAEKPKTHDYDTYFLPFALPTYATLAPDTLAGGAQRPHRFSEHVSSSGEVESVNSILGLSGPTRRGRMPPPAAAVIARLQGSHRDPIDLTGEIAQSRSERPVEDLGRIDMKHLHFGEDVRPPYVGSYTKTVSLIKATRAARNPTFRVREDTNYDYDSEAEWEEPEEGEDLLSDGEEDAESIGSADEMDGFVDEVVDNRQRNIAEMDPVSTGLCWEHHTAVREDTVCGEFDLASMRLEWLIDSKSKSINPLSDIYWQAEVLVPAALPLPQPQTDLFGRPLTSPSATSKAEMKPPRMPLQPATTGMNSKIIVNAKSGEKGPIMAISTTKPSKPAAQPLQGAAFDEFKEAVDGSNLTKVELLKALKQRFPQYTNASLQETLTVNFARHGGAAADKRWKLLST